jgi:pimeloyl-[acyl-carrier protein] methyl ester esterase
MFSLTLRQNFTLKALTLVGTLLVAAEYSTARADETVVRDRFSDEIVGHGPDLVFIPGLASSRDTWKAEVARLKDHYRLHLIQVAGFAGEHARANGQGPVLVPTAEAIDAYLVEQHLTPATVVGHSLGGTTILYLAEHHPADLKKAMVVDSLPFYATLMMGPNATLAQATPFADAIRSGKSKMSDAQRAQMMASMATAQTDRDMIAGWSKASDPSAVTNALADDLTLDLRPGLAGITTPITLVYPDYVAVGAPKGGTDAMYRGLYSATKSMTFVRADNSLHFIMLDQPAQFDAALDAFLAQ